MTLIDFQDLIWGFEIQDVAIALVAFDRFEAAPAYRTRSGAGYEAVRPWPDADPETVAALRAARHLNVLNFGLSVRKPGLDDVRRRGTPAAWSTGCAMTG